MNFALSEWIGLLIGGSVLLMFLMTVLSRLKNSISLRRTLTHRVICRLCSHAFESHSSASIVDCPHCGAHTERHR